MRKASTNAPAIVLNIGKIVAEVVSKDWKLIEEKPTGALDGVRKALGW